jgi:hypothetical protein
MFRAARDNKASTLRAALVAGLLCTSQAARRGDGGVHGESLPATDGDVSVQSDSLGVGTSLHSKRGEGELHQNRQEAQLLRTPAL